MSDDDQLFSGSDDNQTYLNHEPNKEIKKFTDPDDDDTSINNNILKKVEIIPIKKKIEQKPDSDFESDNLDGDQKDFKEEKKKSLSSDEDKNVDSPSSDEEQNYKSKSSKKRTPKEPQIELPPEIKDIYEELFPSNKNVQETDTDKKERKDKLDQEVMEILQKIEKAYKEDHRSFIEKTKNSFSRLNLLKELSTILKNYKTCKYLLRNNILIELGKWLQPFEINGPSPILSIKEKIFTLLQIINDTIISYEKNYDVKSKKREIDEETIEEKRDIYLTFLQNSKIIDIVEKTEIPEGCTAHKIRSDLIAHWKRLSIGADSGRHIQKSTMFGNKSDISESIKSHIKDIRFNSQIQTDQLKKIERNVDQYRKTKYSNKHKNPMLPSRTILPDKHTRK